MVHKIESIPLSDSTRAYTQRSKAGWLPGLLHFLMNARKPHGLFVSVSTVDK